MVRVFKKNSQMEDIIYLAKHPRMRERALCCVRAFVYVCRLPQSLARLLRWLGYRSLMQCRVGMAHGASAL